MLDKLPTDLFPLVASFLCRIPIFCKAWNYDLNEQKSLETVSVRDNIPDEEIRKAIDTHMGRKTRYLKYRPSTPHQLHQDLLKTHQLKTLMVCRSTIDNLPECVYGLQHLHVSHCVIADISLLQNLTDLKSLTLNSVESLRPTYDLSFLQGLVKLESLTLEYLNSMRNISVIQKLVNLRTLKLCEWKETINIDFIRKLVNIETLSLKFLDIQMTKAIACLPNLRNVEIHDLYRGNLTCLESLSTVRTLSYHGEYYTCYSIQTLTQLEHLEYQVDPHCCYISWIRHLTNLKSLKIDGGSHTITDISFLQNLTRLQSLSISFTNISVTDNSHMLCLTELTHLEISCSRCEIFDVSTIGCLTKLKDLKLNIPGRVDDLSGLDKLHHLEILDVRAFDECSEFISSLKSLKSLKMCFLSFESLKDLSHLIHLEELEISHNRKICDISDIPLGLHSLTIDNTPLLHDLEPIKRLNNLMKLYITEVGSDENQFFDK